MFDIKLLNLLGCKQKGKNIYIVFRVFKVKIVFYDEIKKAHCPKKIRLQVHSQLFDINDTYQYWRFCRYHASEVNLLATFQKGWSGFDFDFSKRLNSKFFFGFLSFLQIQKEPTRTYNTSLYSCKSGCGCNPMQVNLLP